MPSDLPTLPAPTKTQELIHAKEISEYIKQKKELDMNKGNAYSLVWGQCIKPMRANLKGFKLFNTINWFSDVISLLRLIKGVMH